MPAKQAVIKYFYATGQLLGPYIKEQDSEILRLNGSLMQVDSVIFSQRIVNVNFVCATTYPDEKHLLIIVGFYLCFNFYPYARIQVDTRAAVKAEVHYQNMHKNLRISTNQV